jgi:hypothetical protein
MPLFSIQGLAFEPGQKPTTLRRHRMSKGPRFHDWIGALTTFVDVMDLGRW